MFVLNGMGKKPHVKPCVDFTLEVEETQQELLLGCPWKLVTTVSKLVYNLFTGLTTFLSRGYPLPKYQQDIPVSQKFVSKTQQ